MPDFSAGEKIFNGIIEYPLPSDPTAKDFIFYFVPVGAGYGMGASNFFDRFYKNDADNRPRINVVSLEALIEQLAASIDQGDEDWIREIIIVCHATPFGMGVPLLKVTPSDRPDFRILTPKSMKQLQADLKGGKYAAFNKNRLKVVKHLKTQSWITCRCCNFGQNANGLYALYSFFGGLANVYCPKKFQFFGECSILGSIYVQATPTSAKHLEKIDRRFQSAEDVHQHLIKERFFPKDNHTPDRKEQLVYGLVEPYAVSDDFLIAQKTLNDTTSDEAKSFDAIVASLNAKAIQDSVQTAFTSADYPLTVTAKVLSKSFSKDKSWLISDVVTVNADSLNVGFTVFRVPGDPDGKATINANAVLTDVESAQHTIFFQLFMTDEEDRKYKGFIFMLAAYAEDPNSPPQNEKNYAAINILLEAKIFSNGTAGSINIKDFFVDDYELDATATISLIEPGSGLLVRTWLIQDSDSAYYVKKEEGFTSDGKPAHAFSVYLKMDDLTLKLTQFTLLSSPSFGRDPDCPGVELMSYLDQQSLDDLLDLIDFLRHPYNPDQVVYLHHAQEALQRKKEFLTWYEGQPEQVNAEKYAMVNGGYANLSIHEWADNALRYYLFNANEYWAEVKSSNPTATTIQVDLFSEETLNFDDGADGPDPLDSPSFNRSELQKIQSQGLEKYFAQNKNVIDPPNQTSISCARFKLLLDKITSLGTTDPEQIIASIGDFEMEDDTTFKVWLTENREFNPTKLLWEFLEIGGSALEHSHIEWLSELGEFVEGAGGFVVGLIANVVEVFLMMAHILEVEAQADEAWERKGKIVAVRQWARKLKTRSISKNNVFTSPLELDKNYAASTPEPYYIEGYFLEQMESNYLNGFSPFVWAPERMQIGFDEGWEKAEEAGNELMDKMGEIVDDVLRQGGMDSCMIDALRSSGLLNMPKITNQIMGQYSDKILEKVPGV